jgi:maleylacetoacetate isomerase
MSVVVLHDYWRSSASYRVRTGLNLKNIRYKIRPVDLLRDDHKNPDYLALNPQGLVPTLQIDELLLSQSSAILAYLDETRPAPALLPTDAAGRAQVRRLCYLIAMEVHPLCNRSVAEHVGELAGRSTASTEWMKHYMTKGLSAFELMLPELGDGSFCHGRNISMADIFLVPQIYNAERWGVDLGDYPKIRQIVATARALPEFANAAPEAVENQYTAS